MGETMHMLLATSAWAKTALVVVLFGIVVVQFFRLTPPFRRQGDAVADIGERNGLLGRIGRTVTPLRPIGICEFDGQRVECLAESGYVEEGRRIEVVRVKGTQPTVRMTDKA